MRVVGKIKSWDSSTNSDCFGIGGANNIDHIFPESLGGSGVRENLQRLSVEANRQKANSTKGKINQVWRFSVVKHISKDGVVTGTMYIRRSGWAKDDWKEVIPSK